MPVTVTDVREFTIARLVPPDVKIEGLSYPASAKPGDLVTISWNACNRGGDTAYAQGTRLIDRDTGAELYRKDFKAAPGSCVPNNPTLTMPDRDWRLRIEAGYESAVTAAADFLIGLPVPPLEWLPTVIGGLVPVIFSVVVVAIQEIK